MNLYESIKNNLKEINIMQPEAYSHTIFGITIEKLKGMLPKGYSADLYTTKLNEENKIIIKKGNQIIDTVTIYFDKDEKDIYVKTKNQDKLLGEFSDYDGTSVVNVSSLDRNIILNMYSFFEHLMDEYKNNLKESADINIFSGSPDKGYGRDAVDALGIDKSIIQNIDIVQINDWDPSDVIIQIGEDNYIVYELETGRTQKDMTREEVSNYIYD